MVQAGVVDRPVPSSTESDGSKGREAASGIDWRNENRGGTGNGPLVASTCSQKFLLMTRDSMMALVAGACNRFKCTNLPFEIPLAEIAVSVESRAGGV
jgi:hypothetical protein